MTKEEIAEEMMEKQEDGHGGENEGNQLAGSGALWESHRVS